MQFVKKIFAIALAVSLSAFMVACDNAKSNKNEVSSEKNTNQETEKIAEMNRLEDESQAEEIRKMRDMENEINKLESNIGEEGFIIIDDVLVGYNGVESNVFIPNNVSKINDGAFWSIDYIEAVHIPESVKEIGESAFWSCPGLKFVDAEDGLETIKETAFWSCPSLKDVNLPESVKNIGDSSFSNCAAVTIHASDDSYAEKYANEKRIKCDNTFAEFKEDSNKNVIRAAQYAYENFSEFEIPDDISAIEAEAFQYCKSLKSINIPSNVLSIGGDVFEYCEELEKVDIAEGCTEIGDGAFEYCRKLSNVNIPSSVEKIENSSFDYCSDDLVIHTPKGSYAEKYAIANKIAYDNEYV